MRSESNKLLSSLINLMYRVLLKLTDRGTNGWICKEKYFEISIGMRSKSSKLLSSFINLMFDIVEVDW